MKLVGRLLSDAVERREVLRMARAQAVLAQWDQIVGPLLALRSWPDRYERGTAYVAVQSSAWAQELRMHRDTILSRLNALAPEQGLFSNVRFGVRPLPTHAQPAQPTDPPPKPRIRTPREIAAEWFPEEPSKIGSC